MPQTLTDETLRVLREYVHITKTIQSGIGKRERFTALLGTLFGGTREVGAYAHGAETWLRVDTPKGVKRGRADTVFGSAVIEFEKSLKQTLTEAERQLREYVTGIWQKETTSRRNLDAVATDGIHWRIYRPVLPEGVPLLPENILLELRREIQLKDDTLTDFYRWLDIFLFRPAQLEPTSDAIQEDLNDLQRPRIPENSMGSMICNEGRILKIH